MPAKKAAIKKATKRARKPAADGKEPHKFRHKLLLNQWLISLFGIDPFREPNVPGVTKPLPFHALSSPISDPRMEGDGRGWKDWIRTDFTGSITTW